MGDFTNDIQCDEFNNFDWNEYQEWYDGQEDCYPEDDGQPSEYEEWQDYMGGDDWDHGQYDY
jgi:hypothetical protein